MLELFFKQVIHIKKVCCIFKTMFTMHYNKLNYVNNALNDKTNIH